MLCLLGYRIPVCGNDNLPFYIYNNPTVHDRHLWTHQYISCIIWWTVYLTSFLSIVLALWACTHQQPILRDIIFTNSIHSRTLAMPAFSGFSEHCMKYCWTRPYMFWALRRIVSHLHVNYDPRGVTIVTCTTCNIQMPHIPMSLHPLTTSKSIMIIRQST